MMLVYTSVTPPPPTPVERQRGAGERVFILPCILLIGGVLRNCVTLAWFRKSVKRNSIVPLFLLVYAV